MAVPSSVALGVPLVAARLLLEEAGIKSFDGAAVAAVGFYRKKKVDGVELRSNVLTVLVTNVRGPGRGRGAVAKLVACPFVPAPRRSRVAP